MKDPPMAQLTVRNLDDDIPAALKARAAAAGRSAEAEHRRILEQALRPRAQGWDDLTARRVKLSGDAPDTTDLLRTDRQRD